MSTSTDSIPADPPPAVDEFGGWPSVLGSITDGRHLTTDEAAAAMSDILAGRATESQIAGLLIGLKAKGETVEELVGLARSMVAAAEPLRISAGAIDIVGTGGSGHRRSHALNVSTMACIVAASAGAVVCKHGNRKASSTSGSFDFLEALGVAIELGPGQLETCIAEAGVGFAFARTFHPAMRFAGPVRAQLGVPTVFNLLGPLTNPGRVQRQVIGTSSPSRANDMADAVRALGSERAWVVAGAEGLDELSIAGESIVFSVSPGGIERIVVSPADLGLDEVPLDSVAGGDAARNAEILDGILDGRPGPHRDIVLLNAAAGLVVAGVADDLETGLNLAAGAVDDGRTGQTLQRLREVTNRLGTKP